jgi:CelD/BcsL family acetyltransferase involved in cellulose biosynthesis
VCGEPLLLPPIPLTFESRARVAEAEWEGLLDRAGCDSPYLVLDWLRAWSEGFAKGPLEFHVVRTFGGLAAGVPLVRAWRTLSGLPVRVLASAGLNIAFADVVALGDEALGALLDGALATPRTDAVLLRGVREDAPLFSWLARRRLRFTVAPADEIVIDATLGIEGYRAGRRSKFWSNVRSRRRRLETLGRVAFERHRAPGEAILAEVCAVSMRSWKFREGTAIALLDRFRRFFRALFATPMADVWILRLDGRAIAYRVLATARGVAAEVDIAYDEAFRALSPGTLLAAESNEAVIREGVREISLGQDFPWKAEWSPSRRRRFEFVVFGRGFWPGLVARVHGLRRG